uniref:Checkpoint protein n=1 Tax=Spermophilus dauricus TaxID=99837 RepID=A0A8C9PQ98_SPEDA
MKFSAKITNKGFIELFIQVSGTIAKLAKVCVLRVCQDKLCFGPTGPRATREARLWCEVMRGASFYQFNMEGVSEELNEIYLELISEHLYRAVRSAGNAASLKIQLTNKRRPCLTVAVELATRTGHTHVMVHDLPVRAALKTVKSIVERMANMGDNVLVEANLNGKMNLSIETDIVSIKSYFKNLGNPLKSAHSVTQHRDPENMVQVRVENRKLLQFFEGQQINPKTALCNILSNTLLHLVLVHEDVSLQYFIPAL